MNRRRFTRLPARPPAWRREGSRYALRKDNYKGALPEQPQSSLLLYIKPVPSKELETWKERHPDLQVYGRDYNENETEQRLFTNTVRGDGSRFMEDYDALITRARHTEVEVATIPYSDFILDRIPTRQNNRALSTREMMDMLVRQARRYTKMRYRNMLSRVRYVQGDGPQRTTGDDLYLDAIQEGNQIAHGFDFRDDAVLCRTQREPFTFTRKQADWDWTQKFERLFLLTYKFRVADAFKFSRLWVEPWGPGLPNKY
ncbi:hypothetical protein F4780DRAFT_460462 [Xylariomycetidae sp. FL0641]|nr:hypothetical protein F4780DRAFT_460462 [Xylariomycetidae sp. FL0641]